MTYRHKVLKVTFISMLMVLVVGALTLVSISQNGNQIANAQSDEWATEFSQELGIGLLAEFDSSGPMAWDPEAHPLVFITTEGPGYAGQLSGTTTSPGLAIIDANTREVVASAHFTFEDATEYFEPHGLGVSADGRWIYIPTGTNPGFGAVGTGRLLIVDALTLKLNKILSTPTNPHHAKAFTNSQGQDLVLAYGFREGGLYTLDPANDNRIVGGIPNNDLLGRGYLGFVEPSGRYLFVGTRPPRGVDSEGTVAIVDTESWELVRNIGIHDSSPIWVTFSGDGTEAFVSGGHESLVIKIDISDPSPSNWEVAGLSRAGLEGPYGNHLNWDDTQVWTIGKGEGSHNLGISVGLVDPNRMNNPESTARPLGVYHTGCLRADHGTLHPDDALDQLWITCNSSFEIVVFDMFEREVIDRIPMPNGGSTHSGSFVEYTVDDMGTLEGVVLSDQNGLRASALETKRAIVGQ